MLAYNNGRGIQLLEMHCTNPEAHPHAQEALEIHWDKGFNENWFCPRSRPQTDRPGFQVFAGTWVETESGPDHEPDSLFKGIWWQMPATPSSCLDAIDRFERIAEARIRAAKEAHDAIATEAL